MAGQGQVPARQAAVKAGIPMRVPSVNVNKVCLSGLNAIYLADQMVRSGDAQIVVAGGMESMTNAPYIAPGARGGVPIRQRRARRHHRPRWPVVLVRRMPDGHRHRQLHERQHQPRGMDEVAAASHERAAIATKDGLLAEEIIPVSIPQRRGDPIVVEHDEGVRPGTTAESLGALRPAFVEGGTITAGNASQISDGGSAVIVMSAELAAARGVYAARRDRVVRHGRRARQPGAQPAARQRHPRRARQDRSRRRRPRPVRAQRGVRRGRHRVVRRARHPDATSSTSTAARSRSAIRSA